jgi:YidC/Oxa1 family membrane protein insertase
MLLTMPFIFAFYALLSTAIELRGAPFIFWIHDLSAHDAFFVTPILMGISQIWQQRLAPAAGMDPIQQKMMMLMPVFFTFLFLWYPPAWRSTGSSTTSGRSASSTLTNYMIGPPKIAAPGVRRRAADEAGRRRQDRRGRARTTAYRTTTMPRRSSIS